MNNCSSCGRFRPLFREADQTLVCLDCFAERNGDFPTTPHITEVELVENRRLGGVWGVRRKYPLVLPPMAPSPRRDPALMDKDKTHAPDGSDPAPVRDHRRPQERP